MAGEPQALVFPFTRSIPNEALATAGPTTGYNNGCLITCPLGEGDELEVSALTLGVYQAAIDATDPITIAIKKVGPTGSAVSTVVTGVSIKSTAVGDKSSVILFQGVVRLTAGQSLTFEITSTTPDTAGFGYNITGMVKTISRSAQ